MELLILPIQLFSSATRLIVVFATILPAAVFAEEPEGVLARCGASTGYGFFFHDALTNPDGPKWQEDGISNGKIVLVKLGDEWDIQFDDTVGAYGYRQDGAKVFPLGLDDGRLTVGAFGRLFVDIYTFDVRGRQVAWTSNKRGPIVAKVAAYSADCAFVSPAISALGHD